MADALDFALVDFNPRRKARKAPAARVRVIEGAWSDELWMSERDIRGNIRLHGEHPELRRALDAYKNGREIVDGKEVVR